MHFFCIKLHIAVQCRRRDLNRVLAPRECQTRTDPQFRPDTFKSVLAILVNWHISTHIDVYVIVIRGQNKITSIRQDLQWPFVAVVANSERISPQQAKTVGGQTGRKNIGCRGANASRYIRGQIWSYLLDPSIQKLPWCSWGFRRAINSAPMMPRYEKL